MRAEIEKAVGLLQRGDDGSVEQALALLQNTVFSFSMRVCGQREDAEDTMQEVLLKSVPQLPKFQNPKALLVWLYKVAKNRCLMTRRKSKFAPTQELSLDQLTPYRIVLGLRDMEGLTDDEVAEITGVRSGTVRVRLHRARLFVRKELMRRWVPRGGKRTSPKTRSGAQLRPPR